MHNGLPERFGLWYNLSVDMTGDNATGAHAADGNSALLWLTANEAALYLKVKPRTILKWAKAGAIKGYRLSGTKRTVWRFLRKDLNEKLINAEKP